MNDQIKREIHQIEREMDRREKEQLELKISRLIYKQLKYKPWYNLLWAVVGGIISYLVAVLQYSH